MVDCEDSPGLTGKGVLTRNEQAAGLNHTVGFLLPTGYE